MRVFLAQPDSPSKSNMFRNNSVLQQNTEIPSTELDGEVLLMSSRAGSYYSMSGTARDIWTALGNATTLEEICSSLSATYAVDGDTCRKEVREFIETLAKQQLIRVAEA